MTSARQPTHHSPPANPPVLLLTGFEPFGGDTDNPSAHLIQALAGSRLAGHQVVAVQLPCVFGQAREVLLQAMHLHQPAAVMCTGQAAGRAGLSLERVAINVDDARIPDNQGCSPIDEPVVRGGPAAYFSTWPIKAMVAAVHDAGWPAEVSSSAGTFVCNHVFYGLMHELAQARPHQHPCLRGGFLHVPLLEAQAARRSPPPPSMSLDSLIQATRLALEVGLSTQVDAKLAGGSVA